uniref:Uncharacterized protein n=1 Tax=Dipterocladia arabiensis TaxID=2007176 RepID=A0A1Z1M0R0_9FLOR|nr:hypothetical protein [Dipterocladia arabiensis]ARW59343.1 hypothetical protein [Dipterocladia arabiensis]
MILSLFFVLFLINKSNQLKAIIYIIFYSMTINYY